jgi:ethanolamine utilization microcompartment shell protein EutS
MKARILTTATLVTVFAGTLAAANQNLLNLVMPDATVIAGINVLTAEHSPFGQYVLSHFVGNSNFTVATTKLGFDPTQDVTEVLTASNGVKGSHTGLAMATGTFNVSAITTAALTGGATSATYKGIALLEDPKETGAVAFLGSTIALAGDVASVKAAIDRQSAPQALPASVLSQIKTLSAAQDAWFVTTVPVSTLLGPNALVAPGLSTDAKAQLNIVSQIQSASGGVKFGANVAFNAVAQADNAQNATNLAGMIQLMANMLQLQGSSNPNAALVGKAITASASGTAVTMSLTLPQAQFQALLKPQAAMKHPVRR